jgi:hypothetical protein
MDKPEVMEETDPTLIVSLKCEYRLKSDQQNVLDKMAK